MKILHGIGSLRPEDGGPARSVPALAEATAVAGADVVVCSARQATIDLQPYKNVTFRDGDIRALALEFQPDVIHDHGIWLPSNHAAVVAARKSDCPIVISPRGMLEPWCLKHHRYRKLIAWYLYQRRDLASAAMFHGTSEAEIGSIRDLSFTQPIVNLPNGVLTRQVASSSDSPDGVNELVFVSRVHPVKGLPDLLKAWSELRPKNWQLKIYGPAEDGHDLVIRKLISEYELTADVSLHGGVSDDEKWLILEKATAAVLPSYSENFGIVVAEALSASTPALTTTGTPWAALDKEQCGWCVPPGSAGILEGLRKLTSKPKSELNAMGQRGKRWVEREYLWDGIGCRMLNAYDWLLQGSTGPAPSFVHSL